MYRVEIYQKQENATGCICEIYPGAYYKYKLFIMQLIWDNCAILETIRKVKILHSSPTQQCNEINSMMALVKHVTIVIHQHRRQQFIVHYDEMQNLTFFCPCCICQPPTIMCHTVTINVKAAWRLHTNNSHSITQRRMSVLVMHCLAVDSSVQ